MKKFLTIMACFAFALFGLLGFAGCDKTKSMTAEEVGTFMEAVEMDEGFGTGYKMTMTGFGTNATAYVLLDRENPANLAGMQISMKMKIDFASFIGLESLEEEEEAEEISGPIEMQIYYKDGVFYAASGSGESAQKIKKTFYLAGTISDEDPMFKAMSALQMVANPEQLDINVFNEMIAEFVGNGTFKASKKVDGSKVVLSVKGTPTADDEEFENPATEIKLTFVKNILKKVSVKQLYGSVSTTTAIEVFTGTIQFPTDLDSYDDWDEME